MKKNKLLLLIGFAIISNYLINHFVFAQDKIIAIVNQEVITQRDLDQFLNFMKVQLVRQYPLDEVEQRIVQIRQDILERLIEDRLILQEAKKEKINVDETRVRAKKEEFKKRFSSQDDFEKTLVSQGMVVADLEEQIRNQLLMIGIIDKKVRSKIKISPSEITEYYDNHIQDFFIPEQRIFDTLIGQDKTKAEEAFRILTETDNLQKAKEITGFTLSDFKAYADGQLKKEVEEVLFSMKLGGVSQPVKVGENFYIFKLKEIIPARQKSLAESSETIHNILYEKKMQQEMVRWIEGLKKKAFIKRIEIN
ncbi:MAG: SurA N-terminal domain-containing protein [Candidatus Omnitrophica bacterium]|nr:SurA N-terminal domain-containing protein [Candidatus Omnitrophota bacterium]